MEEDVHAAAKTPGIEVVLPADGALGIQLEWQTSADQSQASFTLHGFVPLPSGELGPVQRSNRVRIGAALIQVNGTKLAGLGQSECVELMKTAEDGKRVFMFSEPQSGDHRHGSHNPHPVQKKKKKIISKKKRNAKERARIEMENFRTQREVESALSRSLNPIHVEVHNMSYWYLNRSKLGIKQFWYRGVEQNKNSRWWETHLYFNGEDEHGRLTSKKVFMQSYKSEVQAVRALEAAAVERDGQDPEEFRKSDEDLAVIPQTHFRVVVVSEKFQRKNAYERLSMVYAPLMEQFDCERKALGPASSLKWKKFAYVGYHVLNLPQYNYLNNQASFAVACMTPVEWNPKLYESTLTDRFGASHLSARKLGNDPKTKVMPSLLKKIMAEGTADKERIEEEQRQKLAKQKAKNKKSKDGKRRKAQGKGSEFSQSMSELPSSNADGTAALRSSESATALSTTTKTHSSNSHRSSKHPRTAAEAMKLVKQISQSRSGGVFSHFYHGLSPEMAEMVRKEHMEQLRKQGADGFSGKAHKDAAKGGQSNKDAIKALAKMYEHKEEPEDPSHKYSRVRQAYIRAAVMMQRQFRSRLQSKIITYIAERHTSASTIQRVFRAYCTKIFVWQYKRVTSIAAITIQAARRAMYGRMIARAKREKLTQLALMMQPRVRAFLARKFVEWVRQNSAAGIQMQRVIRGFMARQAYKRRRAQHFFRSVVVPAAREIQRLWRGCLGRAQRRRVFAAYRYYNVEIPAATFIERVYRGHCGREVARYRQRMRDAAITIQTTARRFRWRKWFLGVMTQKLHRLMAIVIQSLGRQIIARKIVRRQMDVLFNINVVVPCAVKIQTVFRSFRWQHHVSKTRREWNNAILIQRPWRRVLRRRRELKRWMRLRREFEVLMTRRLQRAWRGYTAREKVTKLLWARQATWGSAALKIQAGWRGYCAKLHARQEAKMKELEVLWEGLLDCQAENREIDVDVVDLVADIKARNHSMHRIAKRIKQLRRQRLDWQYRLPQVTAEMKKLDDEDLEAGWAEAFTVEYDLTTNSLQMLEEELRSRKIERRDCFQDMEELYLEKEDLEKDLDENMTLETYQFEKFRVIEIQRGTEREKEDRRRILMKTKNRWKIKSTRAEVIQRGREDVRAAAHQAKHELTDEELCTVSFSKRSTRIEDEKKNAAKILHRHQRVKVHDVRKNGQENAAIRAGFDEVIAASEKVLRAGTIELRRPKSDLREDHKQMCWQCGKVYCVCPMDSSITYLHAPVEEDSDGDGE